MPTTISVEGCHTSLANGAVRGLDVRSAAEFAIGHIAGVVNIPMEQIEARKADIPEGALVLICEAGTRAKTVAGWLGARADVSLLEGGTHAWKQRGYPLVSCAPCR
jgi:rhodanese-related sulfurtransferase